MQQAKLLSKLSPAKVGTRAKRPTIFARPEIYVVGAFLSEQTAIATKHVRWTKPDHQRKVTYVLSSTRFEAHYLILLKVLDIIHIILNIWLKPKFMFY